MSHIGHKNAVKTLHAAALLNVNCPNCILFLNSLLFARIVLLRYFKLEEAVFYF